MNDPAHPFAAVSPRYETDGFGWACAQSRLIRQRRLDSVDWDNVAEEIESVGKSEQSAAESALRILMAHILKWQAQPERRGRSWALTIAEQRLRYEQRLARNPSLKAVAEEMRTRAFPRARIEAAREMDVPLRTLPLDPPSWTTMLSEPFDAD